METDGIAINQPGSLRNNSLYHYVLRYTLFFFLILILEGAMLGFMTNRYNKAYQDLYASAACVREISGQNNVLGELVQKYVVSEEDNADACYYQWNQLTDSISKMQISETETTRLLAEDLKVYQQSTEGEFQSLLRETSSERITELYTQFQRRQEDRSFLCEQLMDGLTAYMGVQFPKLGQLSMQILWGYYLVLVLCAVLMLLYSVTFARSVSSPVMKLAGQARELMDGNYTIADLPVEREDELGYLTQAFNEMKQRINDNFTNREEVWRMQSLLREAEFKALQSQVNPHFLFNVLSVAIESAMVEDADRTVDIIENISYMLHYSLTSVKDNTLLNDEIRMVQSYLFLQKERFGSRISYDLHLPEEIPVLIIPGMTLQPIVENALKHGIEHLSRDGYIRISLTETDGAVEILVEDNGVGISEERLRMLNEGTQVKGGASTGIGIANVSGRMKSYYGKENLLQISSSEGEGTKVWIQYPKQRGSGDDQGTDS